MQTISLDEGDDADWTKQSWDLPPYKSPEFFVAYTGTLEVFRKTPGYLMAVEKGMIVDDEWVGENKGAPNRRGGARVRAVSPKTNTGEQI